MLINTCIYDKIFTKQAFLQYFSQFRKNNFLNEYATAEARGSQLKQMKGISLAHPNANSKHREKGQEALKQNKENQNKLPRAAEAVLSVQYFNNST